LDEPTYFFNEAKIYIKTKPIKRLTVIFNPSLLMSKEFSTFTYEFKPSSILVTDNIYFTLNLNNKRFIVDILTVDNIKDYIDIYLYGVKQPQNRYEVNVDGNNIIVTFVADITRLPNEVSATDFEIRGKIAEIV
jgi:hypothetical protein